MPRVLVVDDDFTAQLILKRMIEGMGYECDTASNGKDAVAAVSTKNYSAILMDMFMPVLNGCDAAISISQMEPKDQPSIVGMVSIDDAASRELCMQAGMQAVLRKPIQRSSLGQCLNKIEATRQSDTEACAQQRLAAEVSAVQCSQPAMQQLRVQRAQPRRRASDSMVAIPSQCTLCRRRSLTPSHRLQQ